MKTPYTTAAFVIPFLAILAAAPAALRAADDAAIIAAMRRDVCFSESFETETALRRGAAAEGIAGKAVAAGRISFPGATTLPRAAGTVSWWARLDYDTGYGSNLILFDNGASLYVAFFGPKTAADPRHAEMGRIWSTLGGSFASFPGRLQQGVWHHFALAWTVDKVRFYWNGRESAGFTAATALSSLPLRDFTLGNPWPAKDRPETCVFDEIRVYNRALSREELAAHRDAVLAGGIRRDAALAVPTPRAERLVPAARAAYRISDHAVQVYADLAAWGTGARPEPIPLTATVADAAGRTIARTAATADPTRSFHASIPAGSPLPDGGYRVTLAAGDRSVGTFFRRVREEWEGNAIGVSEEPIHPWTPMTCRGTIAACWGREYAFGPLGLPERITTTQPEPTWGTPVRQILAEPVALVVETDGGILPWRAGRPRVTRKGPGAVLVAADGTAGSFKAQVAGRLEYDGFYRFSLSLEPTAPTAVRSVRLEIALPDDVARLFNMSGIGNMRANKAFLDLVGRPDGEIWNSFNGGTNKGFNFAPHAWLGDDDRGIAFMGDSPRGWAIDYGKPCMDLVREKGTTRLRLLLVNAPATIERPVTADLSLQATPVKPRPTGGSWKKERTFGWHYFDAPLIFDDCFDPAKAKRAEDRPGEKGKPWWRYFCFRSDRIDPADSHYPTIERNEDEWMGDWGPGNHTPSHNDFTLWAYRQWRERLGMTGIYFDNTYANITSLPGSGLAYTDAGGANRGSTCMFGDRDFLKRVRTYFLQQGPPPVIDVHMTDAPIVGSLGFADFWLDGENGGYPTREQEQRAAAENRPLDFVDRWASPQGMTNLRMTMGRMWGVMPRYLYTWGAEETQTVLGLFDHYHGKRITLGGLPRNEFDLTAPELRFHGFWNPDGRWEVVGKPAKIYVSAWSLPAPPRVRLMVSNCSDAAATVDLRVACARFGLAGPVEASDEVDGTILPMEGGVIRSIRIPRHLNRCILLAAPGVHKTGPEEDIAGLNTGRKIPGLSDDFATLSPAWERSFNPAPTYGPKTNTAVFEPWYGTLRIHTAGGYANVSRPFGRDGVSVRTRLYMPTGRQCGNADQTHPMAALYWGKSRYVKCVLTNPWNNDGTKTEMFFVVRTEREQRKVVCPKPARAAWARWDLLPDEIALHVSTDLKTWEKVGSVPRATTAGKPFAGAPSHAVLGTGWEDAASKNDRLRNDAPGIDDSWSYYDEFIVEEPG